MKKIIDKVNFVHIKNCSAKVNIKRMRIKPQIGRKYSQKTQLTKLSIFLPYNLAIMLLGIYPKGLKT